MQKLQRALERVDNKVAQLRDDFAKRTAEMVTLQVELDQATEILTAAESLIGKLGSERDRWAKQVNEVSFSILISSNNKKLTKSHITSDIATLPTHTLLAAGFITYLGNAPEDVRHQVLGDWQNLCKLPDWIFTKFMSTESEMLGLKAEGLPADGIFYIYFFRYFILYSAQISPCKMLSY